MKDCCCKILCQVLCKKLTRLVNYCNWQVHNHLSLLSGKVNLAKPCISKIESLHVFSSWVVSILSSHIPYSREYKYRYFYSKSAYFLEVYIAAWVLLFMGYYTTRLKWQQYIHLVIITIVPMFIHQMPLQEWVATVGWGTYYLAILNGYL